tara:strand:- start:3123 stop:3461 length:339 start_codon:yes stop_codon:yes gene_type:complete
MQKLIIKFYEGKIKLWKSYWLIGELLNSIVILIIFNFEIQFFDNKSIFTQLPFLDFSQISLLSKIIIFFWTMFVTIGIWRSAEKYKGNFIWIILALGSLSYRLFTLKIFFYF